MLIERDPFARQELHAERIKSPATDCALCGSCRQSWRNGKPGKWWLYQFRTEHDGGRVDQEQKLFCSLACREAYYG